MPTEYVLQAPAAAPPYVPTLDDEQRSVVEHPGGPLLVLAGPGAGKTSTLVEVVADRVARGVAPEQILVLTFSRKAADELKSRIARRLARTTASTPAMTFHSFCYGLVREALDPESYAEPVRLLSAAEHEAMIADLIRDGDARRWPDFMRPALQTRGLAAEMQRLIAATRSLDMDPEDLARVSAASGRDEWSAAAQFLREYAEVSSLANVIDHTDLVYQAVQLLRDPARGDEVRSRYRLVVVDEYQDTDPLQVELLQLLAGQGRDLVVVGDPYQSIYGFRGSDVRGIIEFPDRFRTAGGRPAPQITLTRTSRYGARISAAAGSIITNRGVLGAVDGGAHAGLRRLVPREPKHGTVEVETFATPAAEAEHLALMLRRAHLDDGVPWSQMAVLVRTSSQLTRLRRTLAAGGVPVEVAGDEMPLRAESAVRTLLVALGVADDLAHGRPLTVDVVDTVLTGPLGRLDATALRRLGRALRTADAADGDAPRPSAMLRAASLQDPAQLRLLSARPGSPLAVAAQGALRVSALLHHAAEQITSHATPEEVLWTLWDGTDWPRRLREAALGDGEEAAGADHDLDAVCALFAQAARTEDRQQRRSVAAFVRELDAQAIPADSLAQGPVVGRAVQLMTAHRSKGLEWDLVVVAGVQEGTWPSARGRGSFLRSDRLGPYGETLPPSPRELLAEERRLFYVACTRARRRLVVTAVENVREDAEQPSVFVAELWEHLHSGAERVPARSPRTRPVRPLSLRGSIAALRRMGESTDSPAVRDRVAQLLATLAARGSGQTRAAHPDRWWGLVEATASAEPLRDPGEPLAMSGSTVSGITECSLQWFLSHEAKGSSGTSAAQGFGSVVHAIAAEVVAGRLPADLEVLDAQVDAVWARLDHAAPWIADREREEARAALHRFVTWHDAHGRRALAAEYDFEASAVVDGRAVRLGGSMDRVEVDEAGAVHVVDLKTGTGKVSGKEVERHAQLGFYQLAVGLGATEGIAPGAPPGGAELVQLRQSGAKTPDQPIVQQQAAPTPGEPSFAVDQLAGAVRTIVDEHFEASPSDKVCRRCEFRRVCPAQPDGGTILDGAS
ncbi:ATP-dependent helicase [Aeromicrobium wangtongii]|uniref:DNA 3'-5' helicase n=1 Tax=Aeromicrobium wangtongii TaxID=2969247 RepID=A0ABY5M721_9ACTN|nr:ATP-dependent DNA helicase [Aeromicrobium wangtongii]MCD9199038.1 ATP-dependent helicase [Aeromicrobium wangtongii]UUP12931.1 ATP-dependent helicase [Aeromicrobium wangtongii]